MPANDSIETFRAADGALNMVVISPILPIVLIVILATALLMFRDKIISRLAVRNVRRRKATTVLVIAGLLIGTAMISSALVTGDTMNVLFTRGAYLSFGGVDEGVYNLNSQGGYALFNYSIYSQAVSQLLSIPEVVGVTPMIVSGVSLFDNNNGLGQSGVVLIGVNQNATAVLGSFKSGNGSVIDPNTRAGGVILNLPASKDLNASVGDTIQIFAPTKSLSFSVIGIDQSFDRSGFPGDQDHAVISLSAAQSPFNVSEEINFIAITNSGGIHQGVVYTNQVGAQANVTLSGFSLNGNGQLYAFGDKDESVTTAANDAKNISSFMLVASAFTIIAGIILIVNIFVMLAEERKKEMGMARALGIKRLQLMKMFLFEGTQYALIASLVGVFAGIAIAYAVLYIIGSILIGVVTSLSTSVILQSFTFSPETIVTGFSAGLLITYLTIVLASWRVSQLNIIRAIRDVPEPPASSRTYTRLSLIGGLLIAIGILSTFEGISKSNLSLFLIGPSLSIFGAGIAMSRFVKNRYAITASSLGVLIYWSYPLLSWSNPLAPSTVGGAPTYVDITAGVFMVLAGVLLVMYNTEVIVKGSTRLLRGKSKWLPVLKIGLSYPSSKKFRTGVTILMVALVMFSVVFTSVLISINQETQSQIVKADSGGYDLVATTPFPVYNLGDLISTDSNVSSSIVGVTAFSGGYVSTKDLSQKEPTTSFISYVGASSNAVGKDNFFNTSTFNMTSAMPAYLLAGGKVDTQKVWNAVESNPDYVVFSISAFRPYGSPVPSEHAGDLVAFTLPNNTVTNVTIIAILNGGELSGLVSTAQFVDTRMQTNSSQFALISLANSGQGDNVAISMRRDFLTYAMQVTVIQEVLAKELSTSQSFYTLFQGFFALGLIVGIAGLSIISARTVVERRQEIGMVRALGFTKRMILGSFLLENSFVALLGIVIGALLAVDLGYSFASSSSVTFTPPYVGIVEIIMIVYAFAMLGTAFSAMRAAKTTSAEALRYTE